MDYKVVENYYVGDNIYYIKIEGKFNAKMGQFYMLRAWDNFPLLSRPISIFEVEENYISFLYKVVGKGTEIISKLREYDYIKLEGPYGNGFEKVKGKIALVGGGVGIAPLYMVAKELENCDAYLGFNEEEIMLDIFSKECENVFTTKGSTFITDILDVEKYDYIMVCGPTPMMKKILDMANETRTRVQVSLENHMACGVGACLVCTCKTHSGNKKTCKDGPVFWGEDVIL
ncbi:dihydroorotate dehydrogenase electron transfer subunit [Peptostreptococcus equinus]|uniref:Dihydroorotate dehydrogenase electron transfer subunit n=1 Tax=Peptostreptococcus equinus TaxID=3003601 RepID=A0ABY7JQ83_9FIRM|nr:dihydroorotate dehydrogenase electron transfer subunit [Peptostreptococcus sp. CBA3647]WAW14654.1 dihydroorotate dehydrogenase electron transfer subunit [Peptostreptococcus sp. CBA3647]